MSQASPIYTREFLPQSGQKKKLGEILLPQCGQDRTVTS